MKHALPTCVPRERQGAPAAPAGGLATARWEALGTSVVLRVTDPLWLPRASVIVARELDAIDRACSRFRADSDLARVNTHAGGFPVHVSSLLIEALQLALRAAELTDGDVDPTVGAALVLAGYDRDWSLLEPAGEPAQEPGRRPAQEPGRRPAQTPDLPTAESNRHPPQVPDLPGPPHLSTPPTVTARLRSGHRTVELDPMLATVRVPRGVVLDLGATAKAWAADRAARAVREAARCGVLVSLGGDIATAGPSPAGGWRIHVTDDHRSSPDAPGQTIAIASGGLATSSTAIRRWRQGAATMHHIIDPSVGVPVRGPWRTVSVAAADCTDANIACTAALVRGACAPRWLEQLGLPARLVAHSGDVVRIGGWPADMAALAPHAPPAAADALAHEARRRAPARTHAPPPLDRRSSAHTLVAPTPRADDLK